MLKLSKNSSIYLITVFILFMIISLINKNYLINILFLLCILVACILTQSKDLYENLYYTLLVSSIFEYASYFPRYEKLYYFHLLLAICAVVTFIKIAKNPKKLKMMDKKILGFYAVWFTYIVLSFIWSKNKQLNVKYILIYAMMFMFIFIVAVFNDSKEKFYNTLKVLGFVFVLTVFIGLIEALTAHQLPVKHYYDSILNSITKKQVMVLKSRPVVFFFNTNNYATYLSLGLSFFLYLTYFAKNISYKLMYGVMAVLTFAALNYTSSRANIIATVLIIIVYIAIVLKEGKLKALIYPLVIIVAFLGVYNYSYKLLKDSTEYEERQILKMESTNQITKAEIGEEGSENVRATIIYNVYTGVIKDKKLLGFGAGNTIQHLIDQKNTHGVYSVHGLAIEILGDFGIFIFVYGAFFLYLLYKLIKISLKDNTMDKILGYSLLTSLIAFTLSSFSPSSVTYFLPNYILFALAISFIQVNRDEGIITYEQ